MDNTGKYIVFACAKNENDYIVEWVEHYLSYNFDKIIIADNNDDYSLNEILKDYIEKGVVELMDFVGKPLYQVLEYTKFCKEGAYEWCAYFDCDEFLELNDTHDIKEFLSDVKEDCVCFNWLMYGSNGEIYKKEGCVQERFKYPVYPLLFSYENAFIKSIVRGGKDRFKNCTFNGSHHPCTNESEVTYSYGGYIERKPDCISHQMFPPRYKKGYIKHYYTKSFQEWIGKAGRGWPDGTKNLKPANYFYVENKMVRQTVSNGGIFHNPENSKIDEMYNVIICKGNGGWLYAYIEEMNDCLYANTNRTFIICNEEIDDATFAMLLEIAIFTGNKLMYESDFQKASIKASNLSTATDGCYYILTLQ